MRARRVLARLGTVLVTMGMIGVWAAASASAHVTITAPGVAAGASDATITFRVPDESDNASTVGLKVQLPTITRSPACSWPRNPGGRPRSSR